MHCFLPRTVLAQKLSFLPYTFPALTARSALAHKHFLIPNSG